MKFFSFRQFCWSNIYSVLKLLGEKTTYAYLWGGLALYIAIAIYQSTTKLVEVSELVTFAKKTSIPTFFMLGFIQALCYITAKHIYKSSAPKQLSEKWSEDRIFEHFEKNRIIIEKDFESRVSSLNASFHNLTEKSLHLDSEVDSKLINDISEVIHVADYRVREYEKMQLALKKQTREALEYQNSFALFLAYMFVGFSLIAWVAHLMKLLLWSIGSI